MATTSRVSAGLRSSKVSPVEDSTHSPSMKFLKTLVLVVEPRKVGPVRMSVVAIKPPRGPLRMVRSGMNTLTFNATRGDGRGQARCPPGERAVHGAKPPRVFAPIIILCHSERSEEPAFTRRESALLTSGKQQVLRVAQDDKLS